MATFFGTEGNDTIIQEPLVFDVGDNISLLGGDDSLTAADTIVELDAAPIIDLGAGNDVFATQVLTIIGDGFVVEAGTGDDLVTIDKVNGSFADLSINLGAGNDELILGDLVLSPGGGASPYTVNADGGAGQDTLTLGGTLTDYTVTQQGGSLSFTNAAGIEVIATSFETFSIGGQSYTLGDLVGGGSGGGGIPGGGNIFVDTTGFGGVGVSHPLPVNKGTLNAANRSPAIQV